MTEQTHEEVLSLIQRIEDALDRTHKHGEWNTRQAVYSVLTVERNRIESSSRPPDTDREQEHA